MIRCRPSSDITRFVLVRFFGFDAVLPGGRPRRFPGKLGEPSESIAAISISNLWIFSAMTTACLSFSGEYFDRIRIIAEKLTQFMMLQGKFSGDQTRNPHGWKFSLGHQSRLPGELTKLPIRGLSSLSSRDKKLEVDHRASLRAKELVGGPSQVYMGGGGTRAHVYQGHPNHFPVEEDFHQYP